MGPSKSKTVNPIGGSGKTKLQKQQQAEIQYSSRLLSVLNRFAGHLSHGVENPLKTQYGEAYTFLIKGDSYRHQEEIEAALEHYHQALAIYPDFTEAYIGIGKCLRRKGDALNALQYFKKAVNQTPFDKTIHLELGKCYNEIGQLEQSVHAHERAIKLDDSFLEARFGLALIVELQGNLDYAKKLYESVIAIDSEFIPAYNNLGSLQLRQGDYEKAESIFRDLIKRAPDFNRAYLGLAITLDRSQQKQEALTRYQQVLAKKASRQNVDFIEQRIQTLRHELGLAKTRGKTTLVRVK